MDSRESLVDLVFAKCALIYGRDFAGKWEGISMAEVKADWARELGGYLDSPQAIKHGLEHLPIDKPPTALQFRLACSRFEAPSVPELPAPRTDIETVRHHLETARVRATDKLRGDKSWAWRLKARDDNGERLTITQRAMYTVVTEGKQMP